jgi:general secretion pathway protein D
VERSQGIVFRFDNADLYEVVRAMAEILKINYLIDPKVRGTVNIHTSGAIAQEDVYPILLAILRMNGATIVKRDSIYEVVPFSEGRRLPVTIGAGRPGLPGDRFVIEIIKPRYLPIAELEKVIKPFLSDEKEVIPYPQHNVLIVVDLASNIRKVQEMIGLFDIDIFSDKFIQIYSIANSDVTEVAKELERIFASLEISSKSGRGIGITFTPIARLNSLLVVSSIPNIFDRVEKWIGELDRPPSEGSRVWIHVYYVQNAKAKDLADVLQQIYGKGKEAKPRVEEPKAKPTTQPRLARPAEPAKPEAPAPAAPSPAREEAAGAAEGEINIVVDEANNALVIRALQRDYRAILETIKKLDIYPKQVLIEVLLAEITLNEETKFGIEWSRFITSNPPNAQEFILSGTPPVEAFLQPLAAGFRYTIVELGGRFAAAVSAAATDGRLNVISSPHILASNNKEAKIQIGAETPIITQTYTSTTTTTTGDVLGQTIEYKDIGIILTVTPRISDAGLVTLEIQIEDSTVQKVTIGAVNNLLEVPAFRKKTATTTLSVLEGQLIVIGGLISDTKDTSNTGIPVINKVPLIGALFGVHRQTKEKTETLLLMTPHIITDASQSRAVTEEFRKKVRGIQREIERRERENQLY